MNLTLTSVFNLGDIDSPATRRLEIGEEILKGDLYVGNDGKFHRVLSVDPAPSYYNIGLEEARIMIHREIATDGSKSEPAVKPLKHGHYFRIWKGLFIDWYRIANIFGPFEAPQDHAMKKIMFCGVRGAKDKKKDIQEAIDSLNRWLKMLEEDESE